MVEQAHKTRRRSTVGRVLLLAGCLVAALVLIIIVGGYLVGTWEWGGTDFGRASLWDWLDLLIVPLVLGIGGIWFQRAQRKLELASQEKQRQRELEVQSQRAQDEALQAYLGQMSELLIDKELRKETDWLGDKRVLARARTLTVLEGLNADRKRSILQFLRETRLVLKSDRIVGLSGANLRNANLRFLDLCSAALNGAFLEKASLRDAKLRDADLGGAYLSGADLRDADLSSADLANAFLQHKPDRDLRGADLSGANLSNATLSGANLSGANLSGAKLVSAFLQEKPDRDLREADLSGADLTGADLTNAKVTDEQLASCRSLEGATLPTGSSTNNCDEQA